MSTNAPTETSLDSSSSYPMHSIETASLYDVKIVENIASTMLFILFTSLFLAIPSINSETTNRTQAITLESSIIPQGINGTSSSRAVPRGHDSSNSSVEGQFTPTKNHDSSSFIEHVHCRNDTELDKEVTSKDRTSLFNCIKVLTWPEKKKVLVTGGAGFVGSHLVDSLMLDGHQVIVYDNLSTGRVKNVEHWLGHKNFLLLERDIIEFTDESALSKIDQIYHLASPASPIHYMADSLKTIKTITLGAMKMLDLARKHNTRIVLASTSEVYGNPLVHPQLETYWGNTNPVGPRSCYDESKRLSESLAVAYRNQYNVSIGIARIFNTYGPRMHPNDGRVVSNFVSQAITGKPITIYGSGEQTRSFQYISDLVSGMRKLMNSDVMSPVNLGNPNELTINQLAAQIKKILTNSTSDEIYNELPVDDPIRRRPDIRKATQLLDWKPDVPLSVGLQKTIEYFVKELAHG